MNPMLSQLSLLFNLKHMFGLLLYGQRFNVNDGRRVVEGVRGENHWVSGMPFHSAPKAPPPPSATVSPPPTVQ